MAVGGDFTGYNFVINSLANNSICENNNATVTDAKNATTTNIFENYGMVLGGVPTAQNVSANGNVFIANGTNVGITTTGAPCQLEFNNKTGALDFDLLKGTANNASAYLASIPPNMVLDKEGHLKPTDVQNQTSFTTFKFDSCAQTGKCGVEGEQASDPTKIFFGNGNWTGPEGDETYPTDKPVVFNVSTIVHHSACMHSNLHKL